MEPAGDTGGSYSRLTLPYREKPFYVQWPQDSVNSGTKNLDQAKLFWMMNTRKVRAGGYVGHTLVTYVQAEL